MSSVVGFHGVQHFVRNCSVVIEISVSWCWDEFWDQRASVCCHTNYGMVSNILLFDNILYWHKDLIV